MARPHSPRHSKAVVDEWRRRLLVVDWRSIDEGSDGRLLAVTIGLDWTTADDAQRARLHSAAAALSAAMAVVRIGSEPPDELDAWISRRLVRPGADLLVSDVLRRSALARIRDADRRRTHIERGLRSARIEMTDASWSTLAIIRSNLQRTGGGRLTLGDTLERVIADYVRGKPLSRTRDRPVREQEPGLLDGLVSENTRAVADEGN